MPKLSTRINRALAGFFDTTEGSSSRRPPMSSKADSIEKVLSSWDHRTTVAVSRDVYAKYGPVRGAIDLLSMLAVGDAYLPIFDGKNQNWGRMVSDLLVETWYPTSDIRGAVGLVEGLQLSSVGADREGDSGIILTQAGNGWPQLQYIPAYQIGHRGFDGIRLPKGSPYEGLQIRKGVVTNEYGRPVAYHILGEEISGDRFVSARDMILMMDRSYLEQNRGIPAFAHGLNAARSSMTAQEYEEFATMLASSIAIIEENETGEMDGDFKKLLDTTGQATKLGEYESRKFLGGLIRVFRAGTNSKVNIPKNERPGDAWDKFQDRLIRVILSGMGIPYELVWKPNEINAGAVRFIIAKAERQVIDRQAIIDQHWKRIITYAVAKLIKMGRIPPDPEWYRWRPSHPRRMSVDVHREGDNDRKNLEAMLVSPFDLAEKYGDDHVRVLRDFLRHKKVKKQLEQEEGETFDDPEELSA